MTAQTMRAIKLSSASPLRTLPENPPKSEPAAPNAENAIQASGQQLVLVAPGNVTTIAST